MRTHRPRRPPPLPLPPGKTVARTHNRLPRTGRARQSSTNGLAMQIPRGPQGAAAERCLAHPGWLLTLFHVRVEHFELTVCTI